MRLSLKNSAIYMPAIFTMAFAHMELLYPPPIKSKFNHHSGSDIDYSMTSPLSNSGSDFPCKGYHNLINTPAGNPVAIFYGGAPYTMTITGQAWHMGGSCQASLSTDGGQTFRVLHSYIGNCPSGPGESSYSFRVPSDVPERERAVFAWTWFNRVGNREMYMNCAVVTTRNGGSGDTLEERPVMFTANVGNGCRTVDSRDVMIPDPGPFYTVGNTEAVPPVGECEAGPGAPRPEISKTEPGADPGGPYVTGGWEDEPEEDEGGGGDATVDIPWWANYTPGNDWPEGFPDGSTERVLLGVGKWIVLHLVALGIGLLLWL